MPKVKLDVGATVDFLNKDELDSSLGQDRELAAAEERARLSGVKYMRMPVLRATPTSGTVALGTVGPVGPEQGYAWNIRMLWVSGLSTGTTTGGTATVADQLYIYRNGTSLPPIWQLSGTNFAATFGRGEFILMPGETICAASNGSLLSTNQIQMGADVIIAPSEMIGKLTGA